MVKSNGHLDKQYTQIVVEKNKNNENQELDKAGTALDNMVQDEKSSHTCMSSLCSATDSTNLCNTSDSIVQVSGVCIPRNT